MLRGIGVVISQHSRIVVRTKDDLWRLRTSSGNEIFDRVPKGFRCLNFDLPASGLKFRLHPCLDFCMSFGAWDTRTEVYLCLHIRIGSLTIEAYRLGGGL